MFYCMADTITISLLPNHFLVGVEVFLGLTIILIEVCSQPCTCRLKQIALYNHDHCQDYLLVKFLEVEETDVCLTLTYLAVMNVSNGAG